MAICFIISCASAYIAAITTHGPEPRRMGEIEHLICDEPVGELGAIRQGENATHNFLINNNSPYDLYLVDFSSSCTCTVADFSAQVLKSGHSFELSVKLTGGRYRGRIWSGCHVTYHLVGQPTELEMLELRLIADVIPDVIITPSELQFDAKHAAVKKIHLSTPFMETLQVDEVFCTNKAFNASVMERSRLHCDIAVSFDPEAWDELSKRPSLRINVPDKSEPWIDVPLVMGEGT